MSVWTLASQNIVYWSVSWHHLWAYLKCRIWGPTPDLLNQKLYFNKLPRWAVDLLKVRSTAQEWLSFCICPFHPCGGHLLFLCSHTSGNWKISLYHSYLCISALAGCLVPGPVRNYSCISCIITSMFCFVPYPIMFYASLNIMLAQSLSLSSLPLLPVYPLIVET